MEAGLSFRREWAEWWTRVRTPPIEVFRVPAPVVAGGMRRGPSAARLCFGNQHALLLVVVWLICALPAAWLLWFGASTSGLLGLLVSAPFAAVIVLPATAVLSRRWERSRALAARGLVVPATRTEVGKNESSNQFDQWYAFYAYELDGKACAVQTASMLRRWADLGERAAVLVDPRHPAHRVLLIAPQEPRPRRDTRGSPTGSR